MDALTQSLTEAQLASIRAGIYTPRHAGQPPLRYDRCARVVGNQTQCTGPAYVMHPSGVYVCPKHANAGGVPFPRGR